MRVVAGAVLVLGMVAMHHIAQPEHDASATHQSPVVTTYEPVAVEHGATLDVVPADDGGDRSAMDEDAPTAAHGLLHLCLAVLTAAAVLMVAGWLLGPWRTWPAERRSWLVKVWRQPPRPPPRPHGSALLVSLCVMRT